ncbi:MAG: hypothetical protein J1F12_03715 [Muribaculaceae bacterium]|nr:hypothetical protein [Muribaculaceae bacterium]
MKHAYCIIAHNDPYCLGVLLETLQHEDNDIFLLIDKKTPGSFEEKLPQKIKNLHIIPAEKRININWGGVSSIKAELLLFKEAVNNGNYNFIHLLSGADLPLKRQEDIHRFFANISPDANFIAFSEGREIEENVEFKTGYYHPFVEFQRFRKEGNPLHLIQDLAAKTIRKSFVGLQKLAGYKRKWGDLKLKKGSNWVTLSPAFTRYLIEKEDFILKKFRGVICSDEIFIHTMLYNSPFRHTVINDNLRYIDWRRGTPYVFKSEDFVELMQSRAFFARKFSSSVDKKIIDKIKNKISLQ